jgi:hypothetical protein
MIEKVFAEVFADTKIRDCHMGFLEVENCIRNQLWEGKREKGKGKREKGKGKRKRGAQVAGGFPFQARVI